MTYGQKIKKQRLKMGMTQQFVADAASMARSRVSRLERGLKPTERDLGAIYLVLWAFEPVAPSEPEAEPAGRRKMVRGRARNVPV